jgi:hypothetical protein
MKMKRMPEYPKDILQFEKTVKQIKKHAILQVSCISPNIRLTAHAGRRDVL